MAQDTHSILAGYIAGTILKQPGRIIHLEDRLISSGLIDSFHLVDLSIFIEDTFGVRIDDTELNAETFDTMEQLVQFVQSRQS